MAKVFHASIEVNRCTGCEGLWFDMLEEEHLKAIADSEEIEHGFLLVVATFSRVEERSTGP